MINDGTARVWILAGGHASAQSARVQVATQDVLPKVSPSLRAVPCAPLVARIAILEPLSLFLDTAALQPLRHGRDERLQHAKA
ncbi:hypothetical protein [Hyphomicrobium sp. DY-1]|uniref:hypothetical protein n=1 Tax=Hyphomicrobium sp. DY-1 TaxID=3075650 RepID=UPI0039C39E26